MRKLAFNFNLMTRIMELHTDQMNAEEMKMLHELITVMGNNRGLGIDSIQRVNTISDEK